MPAAARNQAAVLFVPIDLFHFPILKKQFFTAAQLTGGQRYYGF